MGLNPRTIALVGSCPLITRSPRRLIRSGVRRWQRGSVLVADRGKWSCRRQLPKWSRWPRSGVAANRDRQPRSSSRRFCPKRAPINSPRRQLKRHHRRQLSSQRSMPRKRRESPHPQHTQARVGQHRSQKGGESFTFTDSSVPSASCEASFADCNRREPGGILLPVNIWDGR